ncbi:Xaa-Pro peptidase family protein [Virgibacillus dokdonensis]|uniref:Xaa-Pro peptidase family protein n=1 Tax=Virgibacillus dokdonensis TaxID=302167 RepID=A0ABU7VJK6_9BACI
MIKINASYERVYEKLSRNNLNAILISNVSNIQYLTGLNSEHAYVLAIPNKIFLLVPDVFKKHAEEIVDQSKVEIHGYTRKITKVIRKIIEDYNLVNLAFEKESISYGKWEVIYKNISSITNIIPITNFIEDIRSIKNNNEIQLIKEAAMMTEKVVEEKICHINSNMTELDFEKELEKEMYKLGAEALPFRFEVSSGAKSAKVNAFPENKKLKLGELLLIDVGIELQGYKTDIARTFAIGRADKEQRQLYNIVYEFLLRIVSKIRPGIKVKEIVEISKEYYRELGIQSGLPYDIGHGVGLQIHEKPFLSSMSNETFLEGMILSIEPGIYIKNFGGVRLEDIIEIKADGASFITNCKPMIPILNYTERG